MKLLKSLMRRRGGDAYSSEPHPFALPTERDQQRVKTSGATFKLEVSIDSIVLPFPTLELEEFAVGEQPEGLTLSNRIHCHHYHSSFVPKLWKADCRDAQV